MRILFSDEKFFDIDGVYNSQNDRVWAVDRADADEKGGIQQRRKFPQKVMVWLGACSKGITPLVISYDGEFDFAAKSKLAENNLYLRENKCFPSQRYKECTLIPLAV